MVKTYEEFIDYLADLVLLEVTDELKNFKVNVKQEIEKQLNKHNIYNKRERQKLRYLVFQSVLDTVKKKPETYIYNTGILELTEDAKKKIQEAIDKAVCEYPGY